MDLDFRGSLGGKDLSRRFATNHFRALYAAKPQWGTWLNEVAGSRRLAGLISNVGEGGDDITDDLGHAPLWPSAVSPMTHPGRVLVMLRHRLELDLPRVIYVPLELKPNNADVMLRKIEDLLQSWELADPAGWGKVADRLRVDMAAKFDVVASIVDQIVPGREGEGSKHAVIAEPYRLWVINSQKPEHKFIRLPGVVLFSKKYPLYAQRKLFLLNAIHMLLLLYCMHHRWGMQVKVWEAMQDSKLLAWLDRVVREEILPAMCEVVGIGDLWDYWELVKERFLNEVIPYTLWKLAAEGDNNKLLVKITDRLFSLVALHERHYGRRPSLIMEALGWDGWDTQLVTRADGVK